MFTLRSAMSCFALSGAMLVGTVASTANAEVTVSIVRGSTDTNTTTPNATTKLKNSCGLVKTDATAPARGPGAKTARIKKGWHADSYKNTDDPNKSGGVKYGDHLTVDLFNGGDYQMTCHVYASGAVWCDN